MVKKMLTKKELAKNEKGSGLEITGFYFFLLLL